MKISLITACYNSAETIKTAIESVRRQVGSDVEYIVVDGASKDGSIEIINNLAKDFSSKVTIISEPDKGMYDAINKGIAHATGEIIGILNSDDILATDSTIADVAKEFENNSQLDAIYADIRFISPDASNNTSVDFLRALPSHRYYSAKHWHPWMHNWGYMPPHPSVYIRKSVFAKLGPYKLGYKISADFELMVRYLCKARIKSKYLNKCLVIMRTGGMSTRNWRSNLLLNQENVRANRANGYFSCLPMMLPKYAFKIWEFVFK